MKELGDLGLQPALEAIAVETQEMRFYNRHGQFAFREARGRFAGYDAPQLSIHRGDLQMILFRTVQERIGADRVHLGRRLLKAEQDDTGVTLPLADTVTGESVPQIGRASCRERVCQYV